MIISININYTCVFNYLMCVFSLFISVSPNPLSKEWKTSK